MNNPIVITPELTEKMLEGMKNSEFLEKKKQKALKAFEKNKEALLKQFPQLG